MQVDVVGGGLAGALLGWRLAEQPTVDRVRIAPGPAAADATAASGGNVRAYEVNPAQRALAVRSMAELRADSRLRAWSGYVECGTLYLPERTADLAEAVAGINGALPGSASVLDAAELAALGFAGLPADAAGVREQQAGYLDPARFRTAVLADLAGRPNVRLLPEGAISDLDPSGFTLAGERYSTDLLVLATGAWTPALLTGAGLPATGLTTKSIQYQIHSASGALPIAFVDDHTGLFGKPVPDGRLLLGLPTDGWAAPATGVGVDAGLAERAVRLATERFPSLTLSDPAGPVTAVDCYAVSESAEPGLLALRPVEGTDGRLYTFTGGSGGAAKTALAASRLAAIQLAGVRSTTSGVAAQSADPSAHLSSVGS